MPRTDTRSVKKLRELRAIVAVGINAMTVAMANYPTDEAWDRARQLAREAIICGELVMHDYDTLIALKESGHVS